MTPTERRRAFVKELRRIHYELFAMNAVVIEVSVMKDQLEEAMFSVKIAADLAENGGYNAIHPNGQQVFVTALPAEEPSLS